eukprot:2421587-Rhodomonas_salina.1
MEDKRSGRERDGGEPQAGCAADVQRCNFAMMPVCSPRQRPEMGSTWCPMSLQTGRSGPRSWVWSTAAIT